MLIEENNYRDIYSHMFKIACIENQGDNLVLWYAKKRFSYN